MGKDTKMLQTRTITAKAFRAGQSDTIEIPRGYSIEALRLRFTGTLSRAAGASAGAGKDLTGAQLIKRIEFRKNGREVVKALSMETLMRLNQIARGTLPEWALSAAWTGYGAYRQRPLPCRQSWRLRLQVRFSRWIHYSTARPATTYRRSI